MNKIELVAAVAEKAGLSKVDAEKAVSAVLVVVTETLASGADVNVSGFGKWTVSDTKARTGRNPSTGAELKIAASKRVGFKASKPLKDAVKG